jgi:hypothetical protein
MVSAPTLASLKQVIDDLRVRFAEQLELGGQVLLVPDTVVQFVVPERFLAKWIPVRVKKTRQNKKAGARF